MFSGPRLIQIYIYTWVIVVFYSPFVFHYQNFREDSPGVCSRHWKELFRVEGEQGDRWLQANVTIPPTSRPHRIVIQAIRGNGVNGDIGVDDIQYFTGSCGRCVSTFIFQKLELEYLFTNA